MSNKLFNYSISDKYLILNILGIKLTLKNDIYMNKMDNELKTEDDKSINNKYFHLNENYYYKLHFGPGPGFVKPDNTWVNVDVDSGISDVVVNFNENQNLPFDDNSVDCIYASHVFEHMSIFAAPNVFKECFRVLRWGGVLRIIIPDIKKAVIKYLENDFNYQAFVDNKNNLKMFLNKEEISIFEAFRAELISPTGQPHLLGKNGLAHQNGWDFETLKLDLSRVGFNNIIESGFKQSKHSFFEFEGSYPSTANKYERSLYVEAIK